MIGPHIIGPIGSYRDLFQRWQPRATLLLDPSSGDANLIKQWSPRTFVIGRVFRDDREVEHRILTDPIDAARWAAQLITASAMAGNQEVDVWQISNEIAQSDPGQIEKLAAFSTEYIQLLARNGLRAAIGGFSVGRPEAPRNDNMAAWGAFLPAMRLGMRNNAVLLLHGYGAPSIFEPDENWYIHRYERVVLPDLPADVRDMPYVYGEYGCDMGVKTHGQRSGWKMGYGENVQAYAEDLRRAAQVLARQPQCLGACVFTLGNNSGWGDFDVAGAAAEALAGMSWPAAAPAQPQAPSVTPTVTPPVELAPIAPPGPPPSFPSPMMPVASPISLRARERIGIDANYPLEGFGPSPRVANPAIIADTGVGWVRLNFVRGNWQSVEDPGWEQSFRQIVTGLKDRGLKIYGLIHAEAVNLGDFGDALRQRPSDFAFQQAWVDRYVDTFAGIVRRFQGDVAVWESFNEPDDWHTGKNNWVHPGWFAIILERLYHKVKFEMGFSQVRLVSGPVQGLTINGNAGAEYLRQTYREGKKRFGWGSSGRAFPFDGVGYHLYVEEGVRPWNEQARQVPITYARYLQGIKDVIQAEEGGRRPIFVSEIGWHSNGGQEDFQSQNLPLGLELLLKDPWIELAVWFCTQDFGPLDGNKFYGVYRPGGLDILNRKSAYLALQTFCAREWEGLPVSPLSPEPSPAPVAPVQPAPISEPSPVIEDIDVPPVIESRPIIPNIDVPSVIEPRPIIPNIDVAPLPLGATNNHVINAFNRASLQLGQGNWGLMSKAGLNLNVLAKDRRAPYRGPALDSLPRLTAEERQTIRAALPDDVDFSFPVHDGFLSRWPELVQAALVVPDSLHIDLGPDADLIERRVAAVWNRFGFLVLEVADSLGLDAGVTVAVLAEVADRRGMDEEGRLTIRFEVNAFWDRWGQGQTDVFARHFSFDPDRPWQKHRWRPSPDANWREVHRSQDSEWAAFRLALGLDRAAALDAAALGFPRMMGFSHAAAGYDSAKAMLDAFASGERFQALAYFDFIAGPTADSRRLQALQAGDLDAFAALHYGPAEAARHATVLRQFSAAFARLDPLA